MTFAQQNDYDFKRFQQEKPLGVQNNFSNKINQPYPQYGVSRNGINHSSSTNNFMSNAENANNRNSNVSSNVGNSSLQMKQAQQMHINQQGKQPENVSLTQQQSVYFKPSDSYTMSQSQTINFTQQAMNQQQSRQNVNNLNFNIGRLGQSTNNRSNNYNIDMQQQQQLQTQNVPLSQQNTSQNLGDNHNIQINMSQSQHLTVSGMMNSNLGNVQLNQNQSRSNLIDPSGQMRQIDSAQIKSDNSHNINQMSVNPNQMLNNSITIRSQDQMQQPLDSINVQQIMNSGVRLNNPSSLRQMPQQNQTTRPMIRQQQLHNPNAMYIPRGTGYGQNNMNLNMTRTPNAQVLGPGGVPIHQQEWRQMMMTHQQNQNFGGTYNDGYGQINSLQNQQQFMRSQQQSNVNQMSAILNQNQLHVLTEQQHGINTIHIPQIQNSFQGNYPNQNASLVQNNDFSLEFLDLPDNAQELLNSLENENFNIHDIL
jgi:hypothetical protein